MLKLIMFKKFENKDLWIVDLEATCWDENNFSKKEEHREYQKTNREVIEIGVAIIDFKKGLIKDNFTYLIKPNKSEITDFCTQLTTITKEDVNLKGNTLQKVSKELRRRGSQSVNWGAWGAFDYNFMKEQCADKQAEMPFSDNFINISDLYMWSTKQKCWS